ncbi:MAG TPA: RIO1 family regulatory kinase/ATPase, partial [Kofleriaceae bacterium]
MADPLDLLLDDGVIDEVLGRIKSGKEATISMVRRGDAILAAKVYKDRDTRSFKNNTGYKEGRKVRNTRTQRAMDSGGKFGRDAAEQAWKSAEADALYRLVDTGVRIPEPVMFYEGVLLMELVLGADGSPAPRLEEVSLEPAAAFGIYCDLLGQLIALLCCDMIHGDLSPYNILLAADGPTLIDFPQVIAAAHNTRAEQFFLRDFTNVYTHLASFDPALAVHRFDGRAIWQAYVRRDLTPEFVPPPPPAPSRNDRSAPRSNDRSAPRGNDRFAPRGNDRSAPRGNDRSAPRGNDRALEQSLSPATAPASSSPAGTSPLEELAANVWKDSDWAPSPPRPATPPPAPRPPPPPPWDPRNSRSAPSNPRPNNERGSGRRGDQRGGGRPNDPRGGGRPNDQRMGGRPSNQANDQRSGGHPNDQRGGARPNDQRGSGRPHDPRSNDQRPNDQRSNDQRMGGRSNEQLTSGRPNDQRPNDQRSNDQRPNDQRSNDQRSNDQRPNDQR